METNTRPARGRQVKPTKSEMDAAWIRLRERASEGNLVASALVIALTGDRCLIPGPPEHIESVAKLGDLLIQKIKSLPESEHA